MALWWSPTLMAPPKVTDLDEAQQTINELCATITKQQSQIAWLTRQMFGRRSERFTLPDEAGLFAHLPNPSESDQPTPSPQPADKQTITYEREASDTRGKRSPIPDDLPRVERIHDLPEDQQAGMKRIGQQVSERIEYEPGRVYVLRDVRYTYARPPGVDECLDGSTPNVITADKPVEGLPRCIAGPSLLAHIAVSKFADHAPLHRLEGILQRSNVTLARSSMCRWMQDLAALCAPLLGVMKMRVLLSHVIQADETPVRQQERNRGSTRTCYFYSYVGDRNHPYVLYDYQLGRSRAGPNGWFVDKDGEPLYHGLLQCDAYTGYDELCDPAGPWAMTRGGCWAHARRKFHDVREQFPAAACHVLGQVRLLYDVERDARFRGRDSVGGFDPEQRLAMRQQRSRPVVEALMSWCEDQQRHVLPKSGLGEAITYMLNQADALRLYLDDGRLEIDTNTCERSLRGIAIGRRNWLFTGSETGGKAAAAMFSLITSARRHDVEPLAYLTDLFTRLPATPVNQLDQFLPDLWKPGAN